MNNGLEEGKAYHEQGIEWAKESIAEARGIFNETYKPEGFQSMVDSNKIEEDVWTCELPDPIVSSVVDKFIKRSNVGIKKYGTTLKDNNTDNFLNHLQEELQDAILYTEKIKNERRLLSEAMEVIGMYLSAGSKDARRKASVPAKELYKEYYGTEFKNETK